MEQNYINSAERNEQGQKFCRVCKQWKNISCFSKKKDNNDGLTTKCKSCQARYYQEHKDRLKKLAIENYNKNKDKYNKYDRQRAKDPKRIAWKENWIKNNQAKIKTYQENRDNKKRYSTPQAKIDKCVMGYLARSIKSNFNEKIGCMYLNNLTFNIKEFKSYFEQLFTPEMNWDNFGEYWEIDHIIPKKYFKYSSTDDKEFKICWSLINLRPLEKSLNRQRPKDGSDILKEQAIDILGLDLYKDVINKHRK